MRWAQELLPPSVHFVGGHPMAGKETIGIGGAEADLFRDKPWVVCPSVTAPEHAVGTVVALAQTLGANPVFMDADEHDSYVAAISHLPLVTSSALFSVAFGSAAWPELAQLASSGFKDTTRLASGSPEMAHDIMTTNRDNVLHWIDRMQEELSSFRKTIEAGDSKALLERFARPQHERDNFVTAGPPKRATDSTEPATFSITDFLFGSKMGDMMRKQEEVMRNAEKRAEGGKK
jgi:prephenate dehydrogenase